MPAGGAVTAGLTGGEIAGLAIAGGGLISSLSGGGARTKASGVIGPLVDISINRASLGLDALKRLEDLERKLVNEEPLSDAEKSFLDVTFRQAQEDVRLAGAEARRGALGTLAAAGVLRSGRTGRTIRRLQTDIGRGLARAGTERERSRLQAVTQRRQQILDINRILAGQNVSPQQLSLDPGLRQSERIGSALTGVGGQLFESFSQKQANQDLIAAIQSRQQGIPLQAG